MSHLLPERDFDKEDYTEISAIMLKGARKMSILPLLSVRLKDLRKAKGLTLLQVSVEPDVDLSISYLSDIERGVATPSLANLEKLANFYGISVAHLLSEAEAEQDIQAIRVKYLKKMRDEITQLLEG